MNLKFDVSFILSLDEDNTILSLAEDSRVEDMKEKISELLYEMEDVSVINIRVKERKK